MWIDRWTNEHGIGVCSSHQFKSLLLLSCLGRSSSSSSRWWWWWSSSPPPSSSSSSSSSQQSWQFEVEGEAIWMQNLRPLFFHSEHAFYTSFWLINKFSKTPTFRKNPHGTWKCWNLQKGISKSSSTGSDQKTSKKTSAWDFGPVFFGGGQAPVMAGLQPHSSLRCRGSLLSFKTPCGGRKKTCASVVEKVPVPVPTPILPPKYGILKGILKGWWWLIMNRHGFHHWKKSHIDAFDLFGISFLNLRLRPKATGLFIAYMDPDPDDQTLCRFSESSFFSPSSFL